MLGNLLGQIDDALYNSKQDIEFTLQEQVQEQEQHVVITSLDDTDKRKSSLFKSLLYKHKLVVTFSESIMEKTISARTSESACFVDTSHELFASIEHEISRLDNDVSITNEQDPFLGVGQDMNECEYDNFEIQTPFDLIESVHNSQNELDANPMSLFEAAYKESSIDDFRKLKLDMDSIASLDNNGVLDILKDEEFTSIDDDNISEIFGSTEKTDLPSTPQSARHLDNQNDMLMSPGTFFSLKSGQLGSLGGNVSTEERPLWYTPKVNDPLLEETPADRAEKYMQTPKGSRVIRPPLYSSPSSRLQDAKQEPLRESIIKPQESQTCSTECSKLLVTFPSTKYRQTSKLSMKINNPTNKAALWTIKAIGPPYVSSNELKTHPLTDPIFKFLQEKGKVEANSVIRLSISFFPLIHGHHHQIFHLKTSGLVIVLDLHGDSIRPIRPSLPLSKSIESVFLDFKDVYISKELTRTIHVLNKNRNDSVEFEFKLSEPFYVPVSKIWILPMSFLILPITFMPTTHRLYKTSLIIKGEQTQRLHLSGRGI